MRVYRTVWSHWTIRNERQDDKRRTSEDQSIIEFVFGEHRADEAVEPRPGGEQNSNGNREAGCQRGLLHRKPTE